MKTKEKAGLLSIDRPKAMNALSRQVVDEIDEAIERVKRSDHIKVLVIYSKENFAAGADIKAMAGCSEKDAKDFGFSDTFNRIEALSIPTMALIEGYALGGGLELALACDMRLAAADAKLGFPEINLGIMPGAGGTVRAPRLIGEARAKELILTGKVISGTEAAAMGLVNKAVREDLFQQGMELAKLLASKAPCAMRTAKKAIIQGLGELDKHKAIEKEGEAWAALFNTADQEEGMRAFLEKRKPRYTGKSKEKER